MDLNVGNIEIIVHKKEETVFDFHNPGKDTDGFVLFTDGTVGFFQPGKPKLSAEKGDLILLRKGSEYRFRSEGPCAYVTAAFSFSEGSGSALTSLPVAVRASREVQRKILEAEGIWRTQRWDRPLAVRILLLEIYRELLQNTRTATRPSERIAERAKEFLRDHFRENVTSEEIAKHCGVSASHLRAVFGKETGISVTEFRNRLRIRAAKELLSSNLFSVRETAEALGYCDVYHFSRAFRQATGIPPAKYKNREKAASSPEAPSGA